MRGASQDSRSVNLQNGPTCRQARRLAAPALALLLAGTGCGPAPGRGPREAVRPGIEVLATDSVHLLQARRVGLITNHTGRTRDGTPSALALRRAGVDVVVLFGPEHGFDGSAAGGERVGDARDPATDLPIHSLYGERRVPHPDVLAGLDALVFDVQDIGARYYTYVATMSASMRAAAEAGVRFVVADRPNPIGGVLVQGNVLDPDFASFVGPHPIPMRHGMTAGELALLFNAEHDIGADLHVVPAVGWSRDEWSDATGIPWVATSPNMPTLESAAHYPGTCLFEGTNLSVGRGTAAPFQQVGAPWLDAAGLVERLGTRPVPGVRLVATEFTPVRPDDGKYDGTTVRGVRLEVTDRSVYDPTRLAVLLLSAMRSEAGGNWGWRASIDRLAGTDDLRLAIDSGRPADDLTRVWRRQLEAFRDVRARYLIY